MKNKLIIGLFVFLLVLPLAFSLKANIGSARAIISETYTGKTLNFERSILVNNVNEIPVNVTLRTLTSGLEEAVTIIDKEFILQPGESKEAKYLVTIDSPHSYQGDIGVQFTEGKHNAGLSSVLFINVYDEDGEVYPVKYDYKKEVDDEPPKEEPDEVPETNNENKENLPLSVSTGGDPDVYESNQEKDKKSTGLILFVLLSIIVVLMGLYYWINKNYLGGLK